MNILFVISSSSIGFWLAELTHPYWHFSERGHQVHFASPAGGKVEWDRLSNPYSPGSWEAQDLVSKGFLSDAALVARLDSTLALDAVAPGDYDAIHIVGGGGAAVDLYPNTQLAGILESFWSANKVIGAICHGSIALANNPHRVAGRRATGFSLAEDREAERIYGVDFIPNFPQPVMEQAGIAFVHAEPWGLRVVVDGRLVTGQNQQSASEYSIAFLHVLAGASAVLLGA